MNLQEIQKQLKAPKNQVNKFGGYKYRNCEDILEAVKPLLGESVLTLSDEIVEVGGRVYVKSTATFTDGDKETVVTAFAREAENRKGMDDSQITGSASSYARKYALNGLFLIDDTKDADSEKPPAPEEQPVNLSMVALIDELTAAVQKKLITEADKQATIENSKGKNMTDYLMRVKKHLAEKEANR